ncbi:hypothetical protein CPB86DRAFT_720462, partial [Serendipita vermifera]
MISLSIATQQSIISQRTAGKSYRKIAENLGIGKSTVEEYCNKLLPDAPKSKGGRPRTFSATDTRRFVRLITSGQVDTA